MEDEPNQPQADSEEDSPSEVPPFDPDPRLITQRERARRRDDRRTIRREDQEESRSQP